MAEIYNRRLVETKAAMLLIPQSARVLAKNSWCNHFLNCSALNAALNIVPAALHTALIVTWTWWPNFPRRTGWTKRVRSNRGHTRTLRGFVLLACTVSRPSGAGRIIVFFTLSDFRDQRS